jgi:hypothetical protein
MFDVKILMLVVWLFIGYFIGSGVTYGYMTGPANYHKIYKTDSGEFVISGSKIYDLNELKVQNFSK